MDLNYKINRLSARVAQHRLSSTVTTRNARNVTWETRTTFWHKTREDADYLTHEGPRGSGGNTQGSGKTITHLTREEGQVT